MSWITCSDMYKSCIHCRTLSHETGRTSNTMSNTGKVTTGFSMSLDGFVAGPNEDFQHLFAWMTGGDTDYTLTIGKEEQKLKIAAESVERFDDAINTAGALVAWTQIVRTHPWMGRPPSHRCASRCCDPSPPTGMDRAGMAGDFRQRRHPKSY